MQNYHHPVAVGGIDLPGNLFFAPVAGYSDAAFRSVCVDEGADLCFTEMVSSEALIRNHAKTKALLVRAENEKAYAIQLFGSHPEVLAEAARLALAWKPLVVDLNCGCPVPKISLYLGICCNTPLPPRLHFKYRDKTTQAQSLAAALPCMRLD